VVTRQRPFAKDVFASFYGGFDDLVVLGYVDAYGNDIDVFIGG
jgi:hypothetical protein